MVIPGETEEPFDDFDSAGIDLDQVAEQKEDAFENIGIDLEKESEISKQPLSWGETIGDVFTQLGLGAAKLFTWPADILKLAVIGEGLSDIDELEEEFIKAGKPFDRNDYIRSVLDSSRFIPTQDLAEEKFKDLTGISLEPKGELGKRTRQLSEVASFTRGGLAKKLTAGTVAAGTTTGLKKAGVGEGAAEFIGDIVSVSPSVLSKAPKTLSKNAQELEKTARKYSLPFLEFMVQERKPFLKGKLSKAQENQLNKAFNISNKQALESIVKSELPVKRLQERGVNLDALGEHAYQTTEQLAALKPQTIKTDEIVRNIDKEINRIKSLAPSPSDAQKTAIKLLQDERDVLKIANPNSSQLINQHKNYNADVKSIYRKPEFSGKEEQVRKTYEFLKNELVVAIEKQGNKDVANSFKAANKIYHEKSKLYQTENLLSKAFKGDSYNPKALERLLNSKQGNFLRRNMSKEAIRDIEEIAKYGKEAQERMSSFLSLNNSLVANEIQNLGQIAPLIFLPHNLKGALMTYAKPIAQRVQGYLLTRPAAREVYKLTLKHAAEGSYNLLKKDFSKLEKLIQQEYGSVDNFLDSQLEELEIFNGEWD